MRIPFDRAVRDPLLNEIDLGTGQRMLSDEGRRTPTQLSRAA